MKKILAMAALALLLTGCESKVHGGSDPQQNQADFAQVQPPAPPAPQQDDGGLGSQMDCAAMYGSDRMLSGQFAYAKFYGEQQRWELFDNTDHILGSVDATGMVCEIIVYSPNNKP
jgi:hypothetical protein